MTLRMIHAENELPRTNALRGIAYTLTSDLKSIDVFFQVIDRHSIETHYFVQPCSIARIEVKFVRQIQKEPRISTRSTPTDGACINEENSIVWHALSQASSSSNTSNSPANNEPLNLPRNSRCVAERY